MQRFTLFTAIAGFLTVLAISAALSQDRSNSTTDAIFADLTTPGSPGCALGIYQNGKMIYAKGYGLANVEENIPITPQTVFDIASVSKQFTAACILLLENEGKLKLYDDVRKYIPELPGYGTKITILQLLNHTSGVRDYGNLFGLAAIHNDNVTTDDDALGLIVRQKNLNFVPGSNWQYSNSGYTLLSQIIKRVSGKNLKDFAAEKIFQPLGMLHTQFRNDHTLLIPHRALAYDAGESEGYKLNVSYGEESGDGMLCTTIEDLQKWDENFYAGRVGGKDFARRMEEPGRLNDGTILEYAKGLRVWDYDGIRAVSHTGGSGGYRAYMVRFPDKHLSVACLCNLSNVNRRKRVQAVAEAYLDGALKAKARAITPSIDQLQKWAGLYRDPKTAEVLRFTEKNNKLWLDFANISGSTSDALELQALSVADFEPVEYMFDLHMKFEAPAKDGAPRKVIVTKEMERPAIFESIDERKTSARLVDYPGDYWSDELRVTYALELKEGKLKMKSLIGADGIIRELYVPFTELLPVLADEFDLNGAPIVFHFLRDGNQNVTGFLLDGFGERGIIFNRVY